MDYYPFPDQNTYAQSTWPSPYNLGVQHGLLHPTPTQGATAHLGIDKYAIEHMIALATGILLKQYMQQQRRKMIETRIRKVTREHRVRLARNAESQIQTFLLKALRIGLHGVSLKPITDSSLRTWRRQCPRNVGLMDLPVELRLQIYRYLWKERQPRRVVIPHPDGGCAIRDSGTGLASAYAYENMLLEVNKQLCAEAATVFFGENELTIWLNVALWTGKIRKRHDLISEFQQMLSVSHLFNHVRKITLKWRFNGHYENSGSFYWNENDPSIISLPCRSDQLSKQTSNDLQLLVNILSQLPNLRSVTTRWKDCGCWGALWKAEIEPANTPEVAVHFSRRKNGVHTVEHTRVATQQWRSCIGKTRRRLIRDILGPMGGLGSHIYQDIGVKIGPHILAESSPLYAEFSDALADILVDAKIRRQEERFEAFQFITAASGRRSARLAGGHFIVKLKYKR